MEISCKFVVNVTLVFAQVQAILASKARAKYESPLEDREDDRMFEFIHNAAHPDNDITLSNMDMNLQANYDRWCNITKQKRRFKISYN